MSLENDVLMAAYQAKGFTPDADIKEPCTGGSSLGMQFSSPMSDSYTRDQKGTPQLFSRAPLITETQALYQQSFILSDRANNNVNRLNSLFEVLLTVCVFISSFLVVSIEKNWWGGYLTASPTYTHWHYRIKQHHIWTDYKQELYTINNLVRLVIVGSSISFFMIITCMELAQTLVTAIYRANQNFIRTLNLKDLGSLNRHGELKQMSQTQIIFNSQLIVSNIQMLVVLLSVCTFGVTFGVIQAAEDPENHKCRFAIIFNVAKMIRRSEPIGISLGIFFALLIEKIRQLEIQNRPRGKNALEQSLGLSLGEDEQTCFYDDDEEKISLISLKVGKHKNQHSLENLSLKTDSDDEEESEEQMMMRASVDFLAKF